MTYTGVKGQSIAPQTAVQFAPLATTKILFFYFVFRHRKHDDDKMSGGATCCLVFMVGVAQILLHGLVGLVLYWVIKFHTREGETWPFAWREDPSQEFNLHPVLMIIGFIYFMGQGLS